jgi:phosphatidylglycerophosphatase C
VTVRTVAAFDFDRTLSTRTNLVPFLLRLHGPLTLAATVAAHGLKSPRSLVTVDGRARTEALVSSLAGHHLHTLRARGHLFAQEIVSHHLRPRVLDRLEHHQACGDEIVIVSGSLGLYLDAVGDLLGVDAVLCSQVEVDDTAMLTGRLAGPRVWGRAKAVEMQRWLGDQPARLVAYGDGPGDHHLLAMADSAFQVSPRGSVHRVQVSDGRRRFAPWLRPALASRLAP